MEFSETAPVAISCSDSKQWRYIRLLWPRRRPDRRKPRGPADGPEDLPAPRGPRDADLRRVVVRPIGSGILDRWRDAMGRLDNPGDGNIDRETFRYLAESEPGSFDLLGGSGGPEEPPSGGLRGVG